MNDQTTLDPPAVLRQLERESEAIGFRLASEARTGTLLRTLAASKPAGALLELGTGTGVGTAWLLDGMSPDDHREKAECLIAELERREDLTLTKMAWSTGVIVAVKRG